MLRSIWRFLDKPDNWRKVQAVAGRYTVRAYRRMVEGLLCLSGREAVLDVGCGTGEYSQLLEYQKYIGVDYNEEYIRWASDVYGRDSKAAFFKMDVADVPKLNLNLHSAFCIAVTHHLSDDELKKLVADVLAAVSVRFVIVDLVLPPLWKNPLSHVLIRMDRGRYGRTRKRLVEVLRGTGAAIEAVRGTFGFPHAVVGISLKRQGSAASSVV